MRRVVLLSVLVIGMMVGGAQGALKTGPWPSDPELAKVEKEMKEKQKPCKQIKNYMRKSDCTSKVRSEFYAKGLVRGTEQYVDLHYVDLPNQALIDTRKALIELKEQARTDNDATFDREPGELSEEDLASEIQHIEVEMGRRAKRRFENNVEFFQGLTRQP